MSEAAVAEVGWCSCPVVLSECDEYAVQELPFLYLTPPPLLAQKVSLEPLPRPLPTKEHPPFLPRIPLPVPLHSPLLGVSSCLSFVHPSASGRRWVPAVGPEGG